MPFENTAIDPAALPAIEEVEFTGLEKDYLYMRLTATVLFFLLTAGILTVLVFRTDVPAWMYFLPWGILLILMIPLQILGFRVKGFALREKDVSYKSGLIWFRITSVPFNRIQHCEINQGPLGRLFNLASVRIYTAGGSSSDLSISGLNRDRALKLRDYITRLSAEYE